VVFIVVCRLLLPLVLLRCCSFCVSVVIDVAVAVADGYVAFVICECVLLFVGCFYVLVSVDIATYAVAAVVMLLLVVCCCLAL